MKIYSKGTDYWGYYAWIKTGFKNTGISINFSTGSIDLGIRLLIDFKQKCISFSFFNFAFAFFFSTDWD